MGLLTVPYSCWKSRFQGKEVASHWRVLSLAGAAISIIFVATKLCLSQQIFVATKVLSRQKYVCRDKRFVAPQVLSRQAYFCHDKRRVLSRQKWYLWQLPPMIGSHPIVALRVAVYWRCSSGYALFLSFSFLTFLRFNQEDRSMLITVRVLRRHSHNYFSLTHKWRISSFRTLNRWA